MLVLRGLAARARTREGLLRFLPLALPREQEPGLSWTGKGNGPLLLQAN